MNIVLIFVALICIVALAITLLLTKAEDTKYSSKKSLNNQLVLYLGLIPFLALVIVLLWILI